MNAERIRIGEQLKMFADCKIFALLTDDPRYRCEDFNQESNVKLVFSRAPHAPFSSVSAILYTSNDNTCTCGTLAVSTGNKPIHIGEATIGIAQVFNNDEEGQNLGTMVELTGAIHAEGKFNIQHTTVMVSGFEDKPREGFDVAYHPTKGEQGKIVKSIRTSIPSESIYLRKNLKNNEWELADMRNEDEGKAGKRLNTGDIDALSKIVPGILDLTTTQESSNLIVTLFTSDNKHICMALPEGEMKSNPLECLEDASLIRPFSIKADDLELLPVQREELKKYQGDVFNPSYKDSDFNDWSKEERGNKFMREREHKHGKECIVVTLEKASESKNRRVQRIDQRFISYDNVIELTGIIDTKGYRLQHSQIDIHYPGMPEWAGDMSITSTSDYDGEVIHQIELGLSQNGYKEFMKRRREVFTKLMTVGEEEIRTRNDSRIVWSPYHNSFVLEAIDDAPYFEPKPISNEQISEVFGIEINDVNSTNMVLPLDISIGDTRYMVGVPTEIGRWDPKERLLKGEGPLTVVQVYQEKDGKKESLF